MEFRAAENETKRQAMRPYGYLRSYKDSGQWNDEGSSSPCSYSFTSLFACRIKSISRGDKGIYCNVLVNFHTDHETCGVCIVLVRYRRRTMYAICSHARISAQMICDCAELYAIKLSIDSLRMCFHEGNPTDHHGRPFRGASRWPYRRESSFSAQASSLC